MKDGAKYANAKACSWISLIRRCELTTGVNGHGVNGYVSLYVAL